MKPLLAALALLFSLNAAAHQASTAYVQLSAQAGHVGGRIDIPLQDLHAALGLDANHDQQLTWGEVRHAAPAIAEYLQTRLKFSGVTQGCSLQLGPLQMVNTAGVPLASIPLDAVCPPGPVQLSYQLLFDIDPSHRGLLRYGQGQTAVLSPQQANIALMPRSTLQVLRDYVAEGMHHIGIGADHLLFLLCLLLPAVLRRQPAPSPSWQPVASAGDAFKATVAVVTAFTIAHSITLALAALGVLSPPSRWVEVAIATSVALAAANNLWPKVSKSWALAFGFGLIHGFGFAGVLGELGLPQGAKALALFGFNLGVELGQLTVVALLLPLLFALRRQRFYVPVILRGGSLLAIAMAVFWIGQRLA